MSCSSRELRTHIAQVTGFRCKVPLVEKKKFTHRESEEPLLLEPASGTSDPRSNWFSTDEAPPSKGGAEGVVIFDCMLRASEGDQSELRDAILTG